MIKANASKQTVIADAQVALAAWRIAATAPINVHLTPRNPKVRSTNRRLTVIRCTRFDSRRIMNLPTRSYLQGRATEEQTTGGLPITEQGRSALQPARRCQWI